MRPDESDIGMRARAHRALDRLLDVLAVHTPSSGNLHLHYDASRRLHIHFREVVADLGDALTREADRRKL